MTTSGFSPYANFTILIWLLQLKVLVIMSQILFRRYNAISTMFIQNHFYLNKNFLSAKAIYNHACKNKCNTK